ncbi:MAG: hypothetical protein LBS92_05795 [Candidatus Methanoplasma sp.]|jgi:hypothetical protein|nr:hypothetical protein [Candidatus Methanoplasma sp.]
MKRAWLGAFALVAVMVAAAVVVPGTFTSDDGDDDAYSPRTVTIGNNDPMLDKIDSIFDDLSGEYSLDFRGNVVYGTTITIGDVFPQSPADLRDVVINVEVTFDPDNGPIVKFDALSGSIDESLLDYEITYTEDGEIEGASVTYGGVTVALRDLYDPVEDCFAFAFLAPLLAVPGLNVAVAVVIVAGVAATAYVAYNESQNSNSNSNTGGFALTIAHTVVSGISYEDQNGSLISITVDGTRYNTNNLYKDPSSLPKSKYYFAMKYAGKVYVAPKAITQTKAVEIMGLKVNPDDGTYNVWTCYQSDAYNISKAYGTPMAHGPHGAINSGYFAHYHTSNHATNAHAFYGPPI